MKLTKVMMMLAMLMLASMAMAEEPAKPAEGMPMPEMGAPKEMKDLAFLEGTWDVAAKFNMSMDGKTENWMESKATAVYAYVLDGCAMQLKYTGDAMMPGMPAFSGMMLQMYDRETKQWQAVWSDNMGARASIYTGARTEGQTVLQGEDIYGGMKMLSRITAFNQTPTTFDWKMEYSMDAGTTWAVSGSAKYTKK